MDRIYLYIIILMALAVSMMIMHMISKSLFGGIGLFG